MIFSSINAYVQKPTHKYGVEILTSMEHDMELDRCNKNTMWRDGLAKEMHSVGVTLTENAAITLLRLFVWFQGSLFGCFEYAPYTALTIV